MLKVAYTTTIVTIFTINKSLQYIFVRSHRGPIANGMPSRTNSLYINIWKGTQCLHEEIKVGTQQWQYVMTITITWQLPILPIAIYVYFLFCIHLDIVYIILQYYGFISEKQPFVFFRIHVFLQTCLRINCIFFYINTDTNRYYIVHFMIRRSISMFQDISKADR